MITMQEKIGQLAQIFREAKDGGIVFFGGAGVSTESGIPDFRSVDGLYHTQFDYPPETVLSHSFFLRHTDVFYDFYRQKMLCPDAKPNDAHKVLAALEREGKLSCVVTQNIDGLRQATLALDEIALCELTATIGIEYTDGQGGFVSAGRYNLSAYAESVTDPTVAALVDALYDYSVAARRYFYGG